MLNPNGNFIVNGITDAEFVKILEIKIKHEGHFTFTPQQLQPVPQQPGRAPGSVYNNAVFTWNSEQGLAAVHEIIGYLLKKEERREAA